MAESDTPRIASKLVRDKIPGQRIAPRGEHFTLLTAKLLEEAAEVARANSTENLIEELADVMEVVFALAEHRGILLSEITAARISKLAEKGGFTKGVVQDG